MKHLQNIEYTSVENIQTSYDYWQVVAYIADLLVQGINEAIDCEQVEDKDNIEELINDSLLHETLDSTEYVIYTCYYLPIIQYSGNDNYALEHFGSEHLAACLEKGLSDLHGSLAYWALYADVQEKISEHLEDYDPEEEE